jgi:hypothetical protein
VELVDRVDLESIGEVIPVLGGEDPIAAYRSTEEKKIQILLSSLLKERFKSFFITFQWSFILFIVFVPLVKKITSLASCILKYILVTPQRDWANIVFDDLLYYIGGPLCCSSYV